MTKFRRGFVTRGGRQVRETLWAPVAPTVFGIGAGASVLAFTATAAEDALRPYTVVRTHLYLSLISDQLAATERQIVAIGMAVVSDQASAIGVTAVPTPITDLDSDAWYLHQFLINETSFFSAIGFENGGNQTVEVDSKAMRKVEDGFDNILVAEVAGASFGLEVIIAGRQLLKLH